MVYNLCLGMSCHAIRVNTRRKQRRSKLTEEKSQGPAKRTGRPLNTVKHAHDNTTRVGSIQKVKVTD